LGVFCKLFIEVIMKLNLLIISLLAIQQGAQMRADDELKTKEKECCKSLVQKRKVDGFFANCKKGCTPELMENDCIKHPDWYSCKVV
jgi:hypothetical protein